MNVHTNRGDYQARTIVNCAGVYSDQISQMVGDTSYSIHPRKGEYYLLDKKAGKLFNQCDLPNANGPWKRCFNYTDRPWKCSRRAGLQFCR